MLDLNAAVKEQQEHCSKCEHSMEWCLVNKCPYYLVKDYTDEDREYASKILER